jgi:hypothetical protein
VQCFCTVFTGFTEPRTKTTNRFHAIGLGLGDVETAYLTEEKPNYIGTVTSSTKKCAA